MKKKIAVCLGLVGIMMLTGCSLKGIEAKEESKAVEALLPCLYYDEGSFMASVNKARSLKISRVEALGGITPHHLLANSMIAHFFKALSTDKAKVVLIIGPNHQRIGKEKIYTGSWDWQTPFGILKVMGIW